MTPNSNFKNSKLSTIFVVKEHNKSTNNHMQLEFLEKLVKIDSPTGFTEKADQFIFNQLQKLGYQAKRTRKGAVHCKLTQGTPKIGLAAHVDTLGAIVSGIKADGTLRISKIGGLSLNAAEGGYCRIHTLDGRIYQGTLLLDNPAAHINAELPKIQRKVENMHIRIDEEVHTAKDVEALGIRNGDFISFETHYQQFDNGFIKSRFMDNKAGCQVLFEVAKYYAEKEEEAPVQLFFSNYEEVGHGGAVGYAKSLDELLVIDMGIVGEGHHGTELACSICAKDSSGPYDYSMRKRLTELAMQNNIPHAVDVYPYYSSDGSVALRAGNDFKVGLIGPGVSASHGIERTHVKGIQATVDLCIAYIEDLKLRAE
jgi:putative aminopeptidase FrvX